MAYREIVVQLPKGHGTVAIEIDDNGASARWKATERTVNDLWQPVGPVTDRTIG